MKRLILVIGGSGSGKSEFAEQLSMELHRKQGGRLLYLATMKSTDKECDVKIDIHKKRREDTDFVTIEKQVSIGDIEVKEGDILLLECVSNLLANEVFSKEGHGAMSEQVILQDIQKLNKTCDMVIVSNEISMDGITYDPFTMDYIRMITGINTKTAQLADIVYEVVAGIPITCKQTKGTDIS